MLAVDLVKLRVVGDAVEEERIERTSWAGERRVDGVELLYIRTEIGRGAHAGEEGRPGRRHLCPGFPKAPSRSPRAEAAQHVVGAELDDQRVSPAGTPSRIARARPRLFRRTRLRWDLDVRSLGVKGGLRATRKRLARRHAEAGGQAVSEDDAPVRRAAAGEAAARTAASAAAWTRRSQ